jgi:prophage regulatory protein
LADDAKQLIASRPIHSSAAAISNGDRIVEHRRLIRLPEVIRRVGLKKSSLYSYIAKGWFPQSVPLGVRSVAWDEQAIDRWVADRIAAGSDEIGAR